MNQKANWATTAFVLLLVAAPAAATTWHVPGDRPTIALGLDAASAGDTVLVACGDYLEHSLIMKSGVCLRGETDEINCATISGEGSYQIMICDGVSSDTRIERITFAEGLAAEGGALRCINGAKPNIYRCRFKNNTAVELGGAVLSHLGSWPQFRECDFAGNAVTNAPGSDYGGGAIFCISSSSVAARDCLFIGNQSNEDGGAICGNGFTSIVLDGCTFDANFANHRGAAIHVFAGQLTLTDCLLINNTTPFSGSALSAFYIDPLSITRCTIVRNSANYEGNIFLVVCEATFDQSIIAFNDNVPSITCGAATTVILSCCDIYGNEGGDYEDDCLYGQNGINGNISADPAFCDLEVEELTLREDSPCANEPGCGVMGVFGTGCQFTITSVTDVDNDQGRNVRVRWTNSRYDAAGAAYTITSYGIWRRIDTYKMSASGNNDEDQAQIQALPPGEWDAIGTVPAIGEPTYSLVAPTLCDSTASGGACWSVYVVTAHTPDPLTYFITSQDSGYSVDNLVPAAPANLALDPPGGIVWDMNLEPDLAYYSVYSDDEPAGPHDDAVLIDHTTATDYDLPPTAEGQYVFVTAGDFAGNESDPSAAVFNPLVSGVTPLPGRFSLAQNHPNPFNPLTSIRFSLPAPGPVHLAVYAVDGRRIRILLSEHRPDGLQEVSWDGRDAAGHAVAAGAYFYKLEAAGRTETRKMALIR